jgi:hypothetical protein
MLVDNRVRNETQTGSEVDHAAPDLHALSTGNDHVGRDRGGSGAGSAVDAAGCDEPMDRGSDCSTAEKRDEAQLNTAGDEHGRGVVQRPCCPGRACLLPGCDLENLNAACTDLAEDPGVKLASLSRNRGS